MQQLSLNFGSPDAPYELRRSKRRRTLAIAIDPDQGVVVYSPYRLALADIEAFLRHKHSWIQRKLAQMRAHRNARPVVRIEPGARLPYLGKELSLSIMGACSANRVQMRDGEIHLQWMGPADSLPPEQATALIGAWYREQALDTILARVAHFRDMLVVNPSRVRVKNQKRRWGTCTSRGALYFNWRLILAPPPILDYVVVHEMCHLRELNHSQRFWRLVRSVVPDASDRKAWLRKHGALLELELLPPIHGPASPAVNPNR